MPLIKGKGTKTFGKNMVEPITKLKHTKKVVMSKPSGLKKAIEQAATISCKTQRGK